VVHMLTCKCVIQQFSRIHRHFIHEMNGLFEACNEKIMPYFTEPKLFHKVLQNVFIFCLITRVPFWEVSVLQHYTKCYGVAVGKWRTGLLRKTPNSDSVHIELSPHKAFRPIDFTEACNKTIVCDPKGKLYLCSVKRHAMKTCGVMKM
jgi:hypothetical protein